MSGTNEYLSIKQKAVTIIGNIQEPIKQTADALKIPRWFWLNNSRFIVKCQIHEEAERNIDLV